MMKKLFVVITAALLMSTPAFSVALHIYGGAEHEVYLGCINSSKYDENSIWNTKGEYGSMNNDNSIWNVKGTYGNETKKHSPWNVTSGTPPLILDEKGNFYGYLTVNKQIEDRATFKLALLLYHHHDKIPEDISGWYEKIFR